MGQALYRKYRSRGFDEVVGQDHIVKSLQNAIKSGRISHAYLFTGPRGVGKTSVARILAHEVNGIDYDDETIHLDIIEIDAASNNGVEDIRDLREKVNVTPTSAKYKVYIIDEVHMLSKSAFNALLKTLEEPPAHCIFILATTESHKLPETIVSRTQRFNFQPIAPEAASSHLKEMAKREKIDISPEAIDLLAEHGSGSFRDSISLLDQLGAAGGKIDAQRVRDMMGLPPAAAIKELLNHLRLKDSTAALQTLTEMKEQGASPAIIAKELSQQLREQLLASDISPASVKLLRRLSHVAGATDPQERLEIDILEAAYSSAPTRAPAASTPPPPQKIEEPSAVPEEPETMLEEPNEIHEEPPQEPEEPEQESSVTKTGEFNIAQWPLILNKVKAEAASIYTALRLADPRIEDGKLILAFAFPLHQKKLEQAKNIDLLRNIIEEVSGSKIELSCIVDKSLKASPPKAPSAETEPSQDPSLQTISNIFGSAEMLES